MKPTIVFMGTPDFAVPALKALHAEFGVSAVVTVPDKPKGRGQHLTASAVKLAAQELGISTILQPTSLKDPAFVATLQAMRPDVFCVIAFRILPSAVYTIAKLGAFNVHASLLPKYRGAAPINHAIIQGETVTGVTSFLLNNVVDSGTIVHQYEFPIPDGMIAGELYDALQPLAAKCAVQTTRDLVRGGIQPVAQDESLATPAPKVFRETSVIRWSESREQVRNYIHGLSPSPCAWTLWNGAPLKVYRASASSIQCPPGTWMVKGLELIAGCGDGALSILDVQLPGKKRMTTDIIMRGYRGPLSGTFSTEEQHDHPR